MIDLELNFEILVIKCDASAIGQVAGAQSVLHGNENMLALGQCRRILSNDLFGFWMSNQKLLKVDVSISESQPPETCELRRRGAICSRIRSRRFDPCERELEQQQEL